MITHDKTEKLIRFYDVSGDCEKPIARISHPQITLNDAVEISGFFLFDDSLFTKATFFVQVVPVGFEAKLKAEYERGVEASKKAKREFELDSPN